MLKELRSKSTGKREIIVNSEKLETRVAVLVDGKLDDYFIERSNQERIVGSIFKGKIQNLEDGLQAAFIDIGMKKNAFIHYWDMIPEDTARLEAAEGVRRRTSRRKKHEPGEMIKKFPVGSEIIVQVTKGAIGTKGPRVTANLSIPGRYLVMMPGTGLKGVSRKIEEAKERQRLKKLLSRLPIPETLGLIVRTAGAGAKKTSFVRDVRNLIEIWEQIEKGMKESPAPCCLYSEPSLVERVVRDSVTEDVDRIVMDSRDIYDTIRNMVTRISRRAKGKLKLYDGAAQIFDHFDVERQLEAALKRKVWLKSGGYLIFDETEALVAIDVNTGRHKGGDSQEESIFQVNMESAEEIARQLKLRNVGGLVVIDFIDMKMRRHQSAVVRCLKDALRSDKARTNVLNLSELGLLEMTRQRAEESVRSATYTDCPYCSGRGKIKSAVTLSVEIQRVVGELIRKHRNDAEKLDLRITVNPTVLDRLRSEDEEILVEMEQRLGGRLSFLADQHMHIEDFEIFDVIHDKKLYVNSEG